MTATPEISSGSPILPIGVLDKTVFRISGFSQRAFAKSVFISPGAMEFALIFWYQTCVTDMQVLKEKP